MRGRALDDVAPELEAAAKLVANHDRVLEDAVDDAPISQKTLARLPQSGRQAVDDALLEACARLLGQPPSELDEADSATVGELARFMGGRLQASSAQNPGRRSDMRPASASALIATLSQMADDGPSADATPNAPSLEGDVSWQTLRLYLSCEPMLHKGVGGAAASHEPSARREAATKLIGNHERVLADIIKTDAKSQPHLERVEPRHEQAVDRMLRELAKRILGQLDSSWMTEREYNASVALSVSKFLDGRIQSSTAQCPGRQADMSAAAADVMRALLRELVGTDFGSNTAVELGSLLRLAYHSRLSTRSKQTAEKQMTQILEAANRNNAPMSIGGALYYNTDTFDIFQVLEGPEIKVRALYRTISSDPRHLGCSILNIETSVETTRYFDNFGMSRGSKQITRDEFMAMITNEQALSSAFAENASWAKSQAIKT